MKVRSKLFAAVGVGALAAGVVAASLPGGAADHLDSPAVAMDGRSDINDVYAFQSPTDAVNTVLIMTVNPGAGVLSPTTFNPDTLYRIAITNDGDTQPDKNINVRFGHPDANGQQRVRVGGDVGFATGMTGDVIAFGHGPRDAWLQAGTFDDPFFFDNVAFLDQVKGAGGTRTFCDGNETDFFAGLNVSAIVMEIPSRRLTGATSTIGVWGQTKTEGSAFSVNDRMAIPAIATVLINDGNEDRYNTLRPENDIGMHREEIRDNLLFLSGLDGSGYTVAEADGVAALLSPDILTLDTSSTAGFVSGPLNGRQLAEDVIDFELFVVTGGLGANGSPVLTSDCVDSNDVAFPGTFPYLADAH